MKAEGHLYANYRMGSVIWKGDRVAEWQEASGKLEFKEAGKEYEQSYRKIRGE